MKKIEFSVRRLNYLVSHNVFAFCVVFLIGAIGVSIGVGYVIASGHSPWPLIRDFIAMDFGFALTGVAFAYLLTKIKKHSNRYLS